MSITYVSISDEYDLIARLESIACCFLAVRRTLDRFNGKDDTLIRNESVKKKLFDILNDDELENACLEDMSQEFERISLVDHHFRHHVNMQSFSSSSDDALYSSPSTEFNVSMATAAYLSSSHEKMNSTNPQNTTDRCFCRSRLITASLDEIPANIHAYVPCSSATSILRPSWYTSPSPQWRLDDQQTLAVRLAGPSSCQPDVHSCTTINVHDSLHRQISDYSVDTNEYVANCIHQHRTEQKPIDYTWLNRSTPLVHDTSIVFPMIQDQSSNILMFI
jgi:hypothetical protein